MRIKISIYFKNLQGFLFNRLINFTFALPCINVRLAIIYTSTGYLSFT